MERLVMGVPFGLGGLPRERRGGAGAMRRAASMGLLRCAGNIYTLPADRSFWTIRGNKIVRLVGNEVDNNEHLTAAPADNPATFLDNVLGELTW